MLSGSSEPRKHVHPNIGMEHALDERSAPDTLSFGAAVRVVTLNNAPQPAGQRRAYYKPLYELISTVCMTVQCIPSRLQSARLEEAFAS